MTETATQAKTTEATDDEQLQALMAERKRLALDVREGVAGADKELRALERKISELARQKELAALADEEAQRREEEQREQAAIAELQEQREQLQRLVLKHDALEAKVCAAIDGMAPLVDELLAVDRELRTVRELDRMAVGRRWRGATLIANYLRTHVAGIEAAFSAPQIKDFIGRPQSLGPDEPAEHDEVAVQMPEPPGPDARYDAAPLTLPSEGLRSTRPPNPSKQ